MCLLLIFYFILCLILNEMNIKNKKTNSLYWCAHFINWLGLLSVYTSFSSISFNIISLMLLYVLLLGTASYLFILYISILCIKVYCLLSRYIAQCLLHGNMCVCLCSFRNWKKKIRKCNHQLFAFRPQKLKKDC